MYKEQVIDAYEHIIAPKALPFFPNLCPQKPRATALNNG